MADQMIVSERQRLIMRYRRQGMTVSEIADSLDTTHSQVSNSLETAYRALHAEDEAITARQVDLERLDELHCAYWSAAKEGDIKAAEFILKTMDRRAKMLGIDAPVQTKTDGTLQIGWVDEDNFAEVIEHGEDSNTVQTEAITEATTRNLE
tara:strand:+ start:46 stop:498 length:453 start_codon:yes stop_codon:yes gene_type:complete